MISTVSAVRSLQSSEPAIDFDRAIVPAVSIKCRPQKSGVLQAEAGACCLLVVASVCPSMPPMF